MKKLLFSVAIIGLAINFFGQVSNLIVFTEQGEKFYLILNGIKQNGNPETNVKVTDLNSDSYKLKIIFEDQSIPALDKNIYFATRGNEFTYNVKQNNKGEYVLRYISEVPVAQAPPPSTGQSTIVYTTVPPPATNVTITETTTTTTNVANPNGVSMGVNINDPEVGVNFNMNVGTGNVTNTNTQVTYSETVTTTTTTGGAVVQEQPVYLPGYSGAVGCPVPMQPEDFSAAKGTIASKSFEDSKLTIAKQITNANCLFATQVREIMMLFTFEDSKLDFAKYAYNRTYDIGNYFQVNDAFEFESSIDELNNYILQNPR
ncbi:MAG: DUF4476 domain-containing protein [Bacteroidota bacterium]